MSVLMKKVNKTVGAKVASLLIQSSVQVTDDRRPQG